MTASCRSRTTSARRPESSFSFWSFVGILLVVRLPSYTDACDAPPRLVTMMIKGPIQETYPPGSRVEYQCRPGHLRIVPLRPMASVCQPDDTWEPLQEGCTRKQCPPLGEPINGQIDGSFEFGSAVHYTCNEGYHLVGAADLHCDLSGDDVAWNTNPPHCEKVLCKPPEQILNGITSSQKEIYEYNEVVIYSCEPSSGPDKYSLVGESMLICSGPDVWSSDPPVCKVVKCSYPVPSDGELLSGPKIKFYYQDKVQLGCKTGFYLQGSKTVVCGANSTWEPPLPQCVKAPTPPSATLPVPTVSGAVPTVTSPSTSPPGAVPTVTSPSTSPPGPVPTVTSPSTSPPGGISPGKPADTLGAGGIAAIVISVCIVIAIIGGYFLYRHKKKKGKTEVNAEYRPYQDKASTPAEH